MSDDANKLIQEQWNSLPDDIKKALTSVPWKERVRAIAEREGLDKEKALGLETETLLVLYGFSEASSYTENLKTQVGISNEQADRITKMVVDEVFAAIEKEYETTTSALTPKESILNIPPEILAKQVYLPEVPPDILPETLPGEAAHDVPHTETKAEEHAPAQPESAATPVDAFPAPQVSAPAEVTAPLAAPEPVSATPAPAPIETTSTVPQQPPASIVEEKLTNLTSATAYPQGKDPYREPLE